jgi:SSS family transporter
VNALTGVNILVAAFLIPIGVIIYTFFGGLKATFFADYLNSSFLFLVILIFVTIIYFNNAETGGVSGLFDKLVSIASIKPVEGNAGGAYLTMASTGALVFGIINIVGNFGTVFTDQAYWQRAIATRPKSAINGFLIGGLAWFAIPFTLATTLGLGGLAIGLQLTPEEISSGLVAPFAASKILGDVGAILILTMLFTAVASAGSAELVAVSSLLTYDIYRTYKKPSATGRQLMKFSRVSIVTFGLGMGILALILFELGVSLQYVYLSMGIFIGSAVAPVLLAISWNKTNRIAAMLGAICGLACGFTSWVVSADFLYGNVSIMSTGQNIPLLIGNLTSISVGAVVAVTGSLLKPERFNFGITRQRIHVVDEKIRSIIRQDSDRVYLSKIARFGYRYAIFISLILVVVWPLPLYFSGYIFSFPI